MDKNVCKAASQADTFIEQCFEEKCIQLKNGESFLNQWRNDKMEYASVTDLIGLDFQHFSMHDKSHSIAILQYMEMVLGKDRVEALCASDLWLLLESAYCHDMGMALTYEDLCKLWEDKDFKKHVRNNLYAETADERKVAAFYDKLDRLVHNKQLFMDAAQTDEIDEMEEFEEEFEDVFNGSCWAVVSQRYIMLLYTGYIRKKHPDRSQQAIINYGVEKEKAIDGRMYGILAKVVFLHGENFEKIFTEVRPQDNGFGAETMHPQFAAAMLRLGDLLDMDSNRFNPRLLEHMGEGLMPTESTLQLKKHKAISHLFYSDRVIQAEARSGDFQVCKTVSRWFALLDKEVQDIVCCWNKIAPKELLGCRLQKCDLKIYYKNREFDSNQQMKFNVDPVRVYDMLIGNNIYKSRLDFIREYLQNAMDASKMKLWLNIKEQWGDVNADGRRLTPYSVALSQYERCGIEVEADIDWKCGQVIFSFRDHGIGMEKECIDSLSTVAGDNWRKRSGYVAEIQDMPVWLRPTGGFGIGVQSAFMIADSVEFFSCSEKEGVGRKVCLESSKKGGMVSEYIDHAVEEGTKVLVKVNLLKLLKEVLNFGEAQIFELDTLAANIFDRNEAPRVILHILEKYVCDTARYSIVPIQIKCGRERARYVGMEWAPAAPDTYGEHTRKPAGKAGAACPREVFSLTHKKRYTVAGREYDVQYQMRDSKIYLWDCTRDNMVIYSLAPLLRGITNCYYKGILISDETVTSSEPYSIDVVFNDDGVSGNLSLNRDKFKQAKRGRYKQDVESYKCILSYIFADNIRMLAGEDMAREIALRTLALTLTGAVKLSKKQTAELEKIAGEVTVRTINYRDLENLEKNFDQFLGGNYQGDNREVYLKIALNLMYQIDRVGFDELAKSVRESGCIVCYMREERHSADLMRLKRFLGAIKTYRPDKDGTKQSGELQQPWDGIFYKIARQECYIIDEPAMCDALKINSADYEQKELQFTIEGNVADGLFVWEKKHQVTMKRSLNMAMVVCDALEQRAMQQGAFPVALCTKRLMDREPLWVGKALPNMAFFSLDDRKMTDQIDESFQGSFLLIPFTESMWHELIREREKGSVTREKYDNIVKDRIAANMFIDWTYCWQLASGLTRLTKAQIWEKYVELLDSVYERLSK